MRARRREGTLELEVWDDGPGFAGVPGARDGGVGLANSRDRLQLLYGAAALARVRRPPGRWRRGADPDSVAHRGGSALRNH